MSLLHVANGHCTTGLIELSGIPGRAMVWCDPLYDGPVPGDVADDELIRIRAEFLAGSNEDVSDVVADLRYWRSAIDQQDYDELVLWYEHDLFDQLNLIQILTHLASQSGGGRTRQGKPISLVSVNAFPGHPHFKGIGELSPAEVAALFEMRRPISDAQLSLAPLAWAAYRSPDPRAIEALLETDTSALPFLAPALARHLEEFPSDTDGLSRSERRMMEQVLDGPAGMHEAFPRMHQGEHSFYITDTMFFDRARDLAAASPSLLKVQVTTDRPNALPEGTIALTDAGREVLDGRADRLRLCGLDRWLGGVHITGHGPAWRWSTTAAQLVHS